MSDLREQVRQRYARAATTVRSGAGRAERGSFVGCIAGALSFAEYDEGLRAAGFADVDIAKTHELTDGMYGAIIRATKPA